jgi:hypothetical protein
MLAKLIQPRIWKRLYLERLGEPFIYNLVSLYILLFGSFRRKIKYDLVPRQPYAFSLDLAFSEAKKLNISHLSFFEFGVASGAGVYNLYDIASKLSAIYSIDFNIYGFDTGDGMPNAVDYRDHPEKYMFGDFPPLNLKSVDLPPKTQVIYGDISSTLLPFFRDLSKEAVVGFISIDVDYYSSTVPCLRMLFESAERFLPKVPLYLDDSNHPDHNYFCGELLAIDEFNKHSPFRKIAPMRQLRNWRIFKNALWLDQMFYLHVFDSVYRTPEFNKRDTTVKLYNPYTQGFREMLLDSDHQTSSL